MKALGWKQIVLALVGFGLIALCLVLIGVTPWAAIKEIIVGSVGSKGAWSETIKQTAPLALAGAAVFLALRAGLFNIGAEGQFLVGAMCATLVALKAPSFGGGILALLVGCAAGMAWALPAGLIRAHRNGHEVITTIMFNNIAAALAVWMITGPLKSSTGQGTATDVVARETWLPSLFESLPLRLNSSLIVVLVAIVALAIWLRKSVGGFELRATGSNRTAAMTAGVDVKRVTVRAMAVSGALAGLAGAIQVLAYEHDFFLGFSSGFGFDALGVAILAGRSPWGIVPSAMFFGILAKGTNSLQTIGVPKGLGGIMLGVLIIVFASFMFRKEKSHD